MTTTPNTLCEQVSDDLASVLDGTASAGLLDHVADCDACRDLKHDAQRAAEIVSHAGADFRAPADFADTLLAALEAARPSSVTSGPVQIGSTRPDVASDPFAKTVATTVAPEEAAEHTTQPSASQHTEIAAPAAAEPNASDHPAKSAPSDEVASEPRSPARAESPLASSMHSSSSSSSNARASSSSSSKVSSHDVAPARAARVVPPRTKANAVSLFKNRVFLGSAAGAIAVAAAVGFYLKGRGPASLDALARAPWSGNVTAVARAGADSKGGLEACDAAGACAPVADGGEVKQGSILRTDARTRAHVKLGDGTEIALDRGSELELSSKRNRVATLRKGTLVADVVHVEGETAHILFPQGDVEVLGTKFVVTASEDRAAVEVARGRVRVLPMTGKPIEVRAGEEATIVKGSEPVVASSSSIADTMEWSDKSAEEVDAPVLRGIGELRARKPGQTKEKEQAVRLAKHTVKVRVVDVVARTEVDETFTNDTDEELEGIFRFPLPPGAQIEKLALEVDGKLVEGAFVDRDKGAAIWRGVIQHAAPTAPKPKDEIIWVPGPWRDPALLEWQRGGRFELKIFPIPKKGSRRVVLAYTQTVEQSGGIRRFTYPLAHDARGTTKIDSFDLDVQVLGADKSLGVETRGYDLAKASSSDGERRTLHADGFVPAGDLTVEYALPDRDKEVTAWAFTASAQPPATPAPTETIDPRHLKVKRPAEVVAAEQAAQAMLADQSSYVAISVRPKLPRWQEAKEHVHAIVVDASRSMFGERFARATHLASALVREMDRRDTFVLLACDTTCRSMTDEGGAVAKPASPGASAAGDVERFLGQIEPDGGSDLAASMSAARSAAGPLGSKELRVIYLGDGTPSVGPTKAAHLETAVRAAIPAADGAVVAVALGADADTTSLAALARGGGGVVVPYTPGQRVSSAAIEVLASAYGVVLREPEIELPAGLAQVTPARLDPIRSGGETIIVARMSNSDVSGTMKLKGKVSGERFEQSYPLKIVASTSAGNAFVPRLFAAAKIAELERDGSDLSKPTAIALSQRFSVASRFTSLLVLESEAMFKAFGLERSSEAAAFTGEQSAESSNADGDSPVADANGIDLLGKNKSAGGDSHEGQSPEAARRPSSRADDFKQEEDKASDGFGAGHRGAGKSGSMSGAAANAAPAAPQPVAADPPPPPAAKPGGFPMEGRKELPSADEPAPAKKAPAAHMAGPAIPLPKQVAGGSAQAFNRDAERTRQTWEQNRARRLVPMKKVFDRKTSFDASNAFVSQNTAKIIAAESALAAAPDSRDKTVDLFALYSTSGRVGEALDLVSKWAGRDALDPDTLLARADLAARRGDRARSIRILGGLVDLRPNDRAIQARLAELHEVAGDAALACEYRISLADSAPSEAKLIADAVRCTRAQGQTDLASRLELDVNDTVRTAAEKLLAVATPTNANLRGDVQVSAEWSGGEDLDIALIDPQGRRTSWQGTALKGAQVSAHDVTNAQRETLAVANLPQGNYVVEVSRASGGDAGAPVRGEVSLHLGGETRKASFNLTAARAEVGTVRVFFTSRLVPADESSILRR